MKKQAVRSLVAILSIFLISCNNEVNVSTKVDSLGKKIDTTAKQLYDSAKQGLKDVKVTIGEGLDKDSSNKK